MTSDAPPPPTAPLPIEPSILAEWSAAMKRGRERSRKQAVRELGEMAGGVTAFFVVLIGCMFVLGKLWGLFVAREVTHVSLADSARTLTVLVLGPVLLIALPFAAAAFVINTIRRRKKRH